MISIIWSIAGVILDNKGKLDNDKHKDIYAIGLLVVFVIESMAIIITSSAETGWCQ